MKSDKPRKKMSTATKALIAIAAVAAVLAVVTVILLKTLYDPHRSSKNAANAAFDAVYKCNYKDFVESTIYNADCMVELGLSLAGQLHNEIEPYFKEVSEYLKTNDESYRRISTGIAEFSRGDEGFTRGIELIRAEYSDMYEDAIEKVARAEIEFERSYRDANGKKQKERDTDVSWSIFVKGKWYAVPSVDENLEAYQAALNLADLAELGGE